MFLAKTMHQQAQQNVPRTAPVMAMRPSPTTPPPPPNYAHQGQPDQNRMRRYEHPHSPVMQAMARAMALKQMSGPKGSGF